MAVERGEGKETARLEAFSDAIFAIVITLLAVDLKLPAAGNTILIRELVNHWPSFFAFVTSFLTILIMWMSHHFVFNYVRRIDSRLMVLNGFLLLFVTVTPFTTSVMAQNILSPDANTAAMVYAGGFFLLSVEWNALWHYASGGRRLLVRSITHEQIKAISFRCNLGLIFYLLALIVSFFSGLAGVIAIIVISGFWAVTAAMGN